MSYIFNFKDNAEYNVSELNTIVQSLVTSGVIEGLKAVKTSSTSMNILSGTAVLPDGKVVELTQTETFMHDNRPWQYVCLDESGAHMITAEWDPETDTDLIPDELGNAVIIAFIDRMGNVFDRREPARFKAYRNGVSE